MRPRPTGVEFLVSRRSDRLSVRVGVRIDWRLGRRVLELRHWGDFAVESDACSGTEVWRRRELFGTIYKLAFGLRVRYLALRPNFPGKLPWLDQLYSCFPHSLPTLIPLRARKRSGAIKNKTTRWSVSASNCSPGAQSFPGYRHRPPPRQEGF